MLIDATAAKVERLVKWLDKIDFEKVLDGMVRFIEGCVKVVKWIDRTVEKLGGWGNVLKGLGVLIGVGFVASFDAFIGSLGSMISKLGIATGAMGVLHLAGSLALLSLTGFAGWQIGTKIREMYLKTEIGQKIDDWMGEKITKSLAFIGLPSAKESVANMKYYEDSLKTPSPPAPNNSNSPVLNSYYGAFKKSILTQESRHKYWKVNPRTGAMGLAQIMPQNIVGWGKMQAKRNMVGIMKL